MEFNGNYSNYRTQLQQIDAFLQDSAVKKFFEKMSESDEKGKFSLYSLNAAPELKDKWWDITSILDDLKLAAENFHSLLEYPLNMTHSDSLTNVWEKLGKSKELLNELEAFDSLLESAPKEIKELDFVKEYQELTDRESEFGQSLYTTAEKMELAFTELTSVGAMEATEDVINYHNNDIKNLQKTYEESLADYDAKLDYLRTDNNKNITASEVDLKAAEANAKMQSAKSNRDYYMSEEYVKEQTGLYNASKKLFEQKEYEKSDIKTAIKNDEEFIRDFDFVNEKLNDLLKFQTEQGAETPEELRNKLEFLNEEIAKRKEKIAKSEERKAYEAAKEKAQSYGRKHPFVRNKENDMEAEILAASEILDDINHIQSKREEKILYHGIVYKDLNNSNPEAHFSTILNMSIGKEFLEKMAKRMGELVPGVDSVEKITLANVRKFIVRTREEDYIYDSNVDFLFDGLIPYVKMMELEGVTKKPSYIAEKKLITHGQEEISASVLQSQLHKIHLEMFDTLNLLGEQNNQELGIKQNIEISESLLNSKDKSAKQLLNKDIKKNIADLKKKQEVVNAEQDRLKKIVRQLKASLVDIENKYKVNASFLNKFWETLKLDAPGQDDLLSEFGYEKMANQVGSYFEQHSEIIHKYVADMDVVLQDKIREEDMGENVRKNFKKPYIEEALEKIPKGEAVLNVDMKKICREMVESSVELINNEADLLDPNFREYLSLRKAEKSALKKLNSSDDSQQLLAYMREQEKAKKELKGRTYMQRQLVDSLLVVLKPFVERSDLMEHLSNEDMEENLQSLNELVESLEKDDVIADETIIKAHTVCQLLLHSSNRKIEERESEIKLIDDGQRKRLNTMRNTSPEAIGRIQQNAQNEFEEAEEEYNRVRDVQISKDTAAENKYKLFNAKKELKDRFDRNTNNAGNTYYTELSRQVHSFMLAKNKLPAKLFGSDSTAFTTIFRNLQDIDNVRDVDAIAAKLTDIKIAAKNYILAREKDIKWLFWKENGKSDSGNARLSLAKDIIQFCDSQALCLEAIKPAVINDIKDTIKSYDEEARAVADIRAVDIKNTILQNDINTRKLAKERFKAGNVNSNVNAGPTVKEMQMQDQLNLQTQLQNQNVQPVLKEANRSIQRNMTTEVNS